MVRVEDHGTMDEERDRDNANLHTTGDPDGYSGRSELEVVEILADTSQQVHLVHSQLLGLPSHRFPPVEYG